MTTKPTNILQWALNAAVETRQGGQNKIEPSQDLKNNGSLDGELALNHFNWMLNLLGLWTVFLNDAIVTSDGSGVGLTKNDHFSFIVAFDKTATNKFVIANAYKNGSGAASVNTIQNATLTIGTPNANGNIPISGATSSNIVAFSLNFKNS